MIYALPIVAGEGQFAKANGIDIWYETFGSKDQPALLLIMGGNCQGVLWPVKFCERLAEEGFYVIRYDHRDAGLSTCFDFEKDPYDLLEVTKDALGLLDFIGIEKAHLFGISMGGSVAQVMAAYFPERVSSIAIMASTCDVRPMNLALKGLPPEEGLLSSPVKQYASQQGAVPKKPYEHDNDYLEKRVARWHFMSGFVVPFDEDFYRSLHKECLGRLRRVDVLKNHYLASARSEGIVRSVPFQIRVPTLIFQGSEDPVFPPDHGEALAKAIAGSKYVFVHGMGHVPNKYFDDLLIEQIKLHTQSSN